jgi:replicative DNA helicase
MYAQDTGFAPPVNRLGGSVPHNLHAEQALLGAILNNNEALEKVSDFLKPEHFFERLHGVIFDSIEAYVRQGRTASQVTIATDFEDYPPVEDGFGKPYSIPQYLGHLVYQRCIDSSVRDYGQTVFDLSLRRQMMDIADALSSAAQEATADTQPAKILDHIEARLFALRQSSSSVSIDLDMATVIDQVLAAAKAAAESNSKLAGLSTGLQDLDSMLGGLAPSDLIIVAGRPGMGKTAIAANIAFSVARSGVHVGIFSMEMSASQIGMRVLGEKAGVQSNRIRVGSVEPSEWPKIVEAAEGLRGQPVHIDQTGGLSVSQLGLRARRMHRRHKLGLIVIDYLQLMAGSGNKGNSRTNDLTEITMGIKALAKELDIPIVALSQLSRQVEQRDDKRPMLSDLRESGSIEQDADVVMFVFREDYYLEREEPPFTEYDRHADWVNRMKNVQGIAEVIIGKARHGPTGRVKLAFSKEFTRFSDLAKGGQAQ